MESAQNFRKLTEFKVKLKVRNRLDEVGIFVQSKDLADFFEEASRQQYKTPLVQNFVSNKGDIVYQYYALRNLPRSGVSLGVGENVLNNFGWLRSPNLRNGLWLPLSVPITRSLAKKLHERVKNAIHALVLSMLDDYELSSDITFKLK